jgi:hypothetical protein
LEKKMSTIDMSGIERSAAALVAVGPPANVVALEERVIALEARERELLGQRAGLEDRLEAAQQRAELRFFRQRATDAHVERVERQLAEADFQLEQATESVVSLAVIADQLLSLALDADEGEAAVLRALLAAAVDAAPVSDEQHQRLLAQVEELDCTGG